MKKPLNQCLKDAGIQSSSFAYFLSEFVKAKPKKDQSKLASLLTSQLKAQAELIQYHLTR